MYTQSSILKVIMIKSSARFLGIIFCVIVLSFVSFQKVLAQEISPTPYPESTRSAESDLPKDIGTTVQVIFIQMLGSVSCQLTGFNAMDRTHNGMCVGTDPNTGKMSYVQGKGGLLGMLGGGIIATYNIPISSRDYIADSVNNFGLTKSAYAQQSPNQAYTGFQTLAPLLPIWKVFRDLVYLLFVVVFILIGLGIMFRLQIDARTVMTIQNQIPKVIIALLLVTFSYAIAGFLVDLMWVAIYLVTAVMTNGTGITLTASYITSPDHLFTMPLQFGNDVLKSTPQSASGVVDVATGVGKGASQTLVSLFDMRNWNAQVYVQAQCAWYNPGGCVATTLASIIPKLLGYIIEFAAFGLVFLVVAVTLVITFVRIWFTLIKAYIYILLDVVLAPFWILSGLLPGGAGAGPWLRDLLANLSAFPVTIVIFLLGKLFIDNYSTAAVTSTRFVPPLIGDPGNPSILAGLIGFAIVLITPEALAITREQLKAPDFKYMATVGKAIGSGRSAAFAIPGGLWKYAFKTNAYGQAKGPLAVALGDKFRNKGGVRGSLYKMVTGDWTKPHT